MISRFSYDSVMEYKELEDVLVVKGYIATTHFDGQDKILKKTLDSWADLINNGDPRANKVSLHHNRTEHVVGKGIEGTAKVDKFPDGEYGLYVETKIDKTHEQYKEIEYRVKEGFIDSFSIEYFPPENPMYAGDVRILDERTVLEGYTLASRPMNKHAVMIKEIILNIKNGGSTMVETKEEKKNPSEEESQDKKDVKEEKQSEESSKDKSEEEKDSKKKKKNNSEEEKELQEFREYKKKMEQKELMEGIASLIEDKLNKMEIKEKVLIPENKETKEIPLEFKEYKEFLEGKEMSFDKKVHLAAKMFDEGNFMEKKTSSVEKRDFKNFGISNNKLEFKGLGITTNQNTDTDYLLSSAELQDVFDPIIYNALNEKILTWNILRKEDFSSKGNNQVQFTLKTAPNATCAFYTGNAVTAGNTTRLKYMTKFKKIQVGVAVDGDMIAAARGGPIGDVFAREVLDATETMLSVMNKQLYATTGLETAAEPIGFPYITRSATYTTLYNVARGAANKLAPDSAGDTYINAAGAVVSMTNLRAAIRHCVNDGSTKSDLCFFTSPTQGDMLRGKWDDARRLMSSRDTRFGFETDLFIDGVPVFEDKDCNTDDIFLVDLSAHKIAIWVPPTLEMLGKLADSSEGFIKSYYAVYNTAPRRMVQIYGNATA